MKTQDGKPIGEVPQKKDPYWWMHPAYRGQQALDIETLNAMSEGAFKWTQFSEATLADPDDEDLMNRTDGYFLEFAQLLYKVNQFRSGPVENWYVVVCIEQDKRWAVGQLRADPVTPIQVFDDLIYDSEDDAREQAEALRSA
tara:strand:- start:44 stop:469 length:426 start_codon:yes stop_codon:yes gene_type:complete